VPMEDSALYSLLLFLTLLACLLLIRDDKFQKCYGIRIASYRPLSASVLSPKTPT